MMSSTEISARCIRGGEEKMIVDYRLMMMQVTFKYARTHERSKEASRSTGMCCVRTT